MDLDAALLALVEAQEAEERAKRDAAQLVADARANVSAKRRGLHAAIVEASKRGMRQKDIIEKTGMTRESIRRILRAGGVEAGD